MFSSCLHKTLHISDRKKVPRHQLLEENLILKDLIEKLEVQNINTDGHSNRLKLAVDTMAKQNLNLSIQIKKLEEQIQNLNNTLEQNLTTGKKETNTEIETLKVNCNDIKNSLDGCLMMFNDITGAFGTKVSDIEEKLFKCYYEYRAENRLLHYNNLLHIFLRFDLDGDGVLNETEFERFSQYVEKVYHQKVKWMGHSLQTSDLPNLDLKPST